MYHENVLKPWKYCQKPFEIAKHVYYAGTCWVGSFLLDTGEGLALIDCGMPQTLYQLLEHILELGFDPKNIRHLLITHAHYDHAGAAEALRTYTGARVYMGEEDLAFMGNAFLKLADDVTFPDFQVDELYHDDMPVCLGRFEIHALHTPGHTPGARSMFFRALADDREVLCGMHGGLGFATMTNAFLAKAGLPFTLKQDFYDGLKRLRGMPVSLTIGSHPEQTKMLEKLEARQPGKNPFVDENAWQAMIGERMSAFLAEHPEISP